MYPGIHAKAQPDRAAYVMAGSGETITYRQLDEASNRGAHLFRSLGLEAGDPIAIFMENHPRFLEICWAAQRSGLVYTPISSRLTAPEVEYIVGDCGAKAFVTSVAKRDVAGELVPKLANVSHFSVGGALPDYRDWEAEIASQPATPIDNELEGQDMLYSSGTTGRPKGVKTPYVERPIGTPDPVTALTKALYGVDESSIYLSPAPLYHAAPLRFNMAVLRLGATSIVMENFDAREALRCIEKYRVTHSQWVPTMFVRMLKLPEEDLARFDVSSLKVAIHAAAPCSVPIKERMIDWWGPILHEYYAGTEGNGFTAINSKEWLEHKGSVGKALTAKVHILGEDGENLPPGEPGLIFFEGGAKFEYLNDPEKTRDSYNEKGWSTLGDVGYLDEEGYLYLTDRKEHMIISGGVNIYPQEAENVLINHPAILDVAVIGVPNEDVGEGVKAVVQLTDMSKASPELEREIIDYCLEHLAKYKCPRSVDFEAELPRHPTGKLYKRLLKDRYWGKHDTRIV